jgi:hypothetical protein
MVRRGRKCLDSRMSDERSVSYYSPPRNGTFYPSSNLVTCSTSHVVVRRVIGVLSLMSHPPGEKSLQSRNTR